MNNLVQWNGAKYWTGAFNPVVGCKPMSEGCKNCWAREFASRFKKAYGNATDWDGTILLTNAKPPKKGVVFCGNMSDWFQDGITDEMIAGWMAGLSVDAINLVLTKRHCRMARFFMDYPYVFRAKYRTRRFPLAKDHIYIGHTICTQDEWDANDCLWLYKRNRWISLEPLLEPINLAPSFQYAPGKYLKSADLPAWVVVGAESIGNKAGRECKLEWVEQIVEQCQKAKIPVFVKQLHINGQLVKDIEKFPEHLRIRQVPWAVR